MEDFGFLLTKTFATTKKKKRDWPFVPGKYFVLDSTAPVAVTTLGSVQLAKDINKRKPEGLCIVGKVETENIGIEKIIQNILSNPAIKFLICAGNEPPKHLTGATLISLFENGVDDNKRIIGSPGMRPVLPNTSPDEVEAFRRSVTPINMVGCTDVEEIAAQVIKLALSAAGSEAKPLSYEQAVKAHMVPTEEIETIQAVGDDPHRIKMDPGGYFVINPEDGRILVEHYDYKEKIIRVIEGTDARSIYFTLVNNGWVTKLDHACYLGKELAKAELSLEHGFEFTQDGA